MKKIAVLTLALILALGCLAGCAKDPASNESKAPDASTAAPAESTAAPAAVSLNLEEVYNNLISGCAEDVSCFPPLTKSWTASIPA